VVVNSGFRAHREARQRQQLLVFLSNEIRAGRGGNTMMMCKPDAPFHYVTKAGFYELDGVIIDTTWKEKVYDYPVKTYKEWLNEMLVESTRQAKQKVSTRQGCLLNE